MSAYFDIRGEFFKSYFDRALPIDAYIETGSGAHKSRWRSAPPKLDEPQRALCAGFIRKLNLLVLSGIWCGDCARQGPALAAIAAASSIIDLRFIESSQAPELVDELRLMGGQRVPVVVALSEDFFEIGRVGDRMLSAYRRKAATEFGPTCDLGGAAVDGEADDLREWLSAIERWQIMLRLAPMLRRRYGD